MPARLFVSSPPDYSLAPPNQVEFFFSFFSFLFSVSPFPVAGPRRVPHTHAGPPAADNLSAPPASPDRPPFPPVAGPPPPHPPPPGLSPARRPQPVRHASVT